MLTRKAIEVDQLWEYPVLPGTLVVISPYALHRHPEFWPEPEQFQPERFREAPEGLHRFAYIPFGAGPRLCIGSQFATLEAQLILAMVTQRFGLELAPGPEIHAEALVTLRPRHGMPVKVRKL